MRIRENPEILERMMEALPGIVALVDRDRIIRYTNRIDPGIEAKHVLGTPVERLLDPGSVPRFREAMATVFQDGNSTSYESRVVLPDGSTAWYRSEAVPLEEDGQVIWAMISTREISEIKRLERELSRTRSLLPICSWCDRIRSEDGLWRDIATYLKEAQDTSVSHGMCPRCADRMEGTPPTGAA